MKNVRFSGQSLHSYCIISIIRIRKTLISYVKLDHTLYSINYGNLFIMHCVGYSFPLSHCEPLLHVHTCIILIL